MKKLLTFIAISAMTLTAQAVAVDLTQTNDIWDLGYTTGTINTGDTIDFSEIANGGTLSMMIKVNSLPTETPYATFLSAWNNFKLGSDGAIWYMSFKLGEIQEGDTFSLALQIQDGGKYDIYFNGVLAASADNLTIDNNLGTELGFFTNKDGNDLEFTFVGMSTTDQGTTIGVPEPTAMALLLMGVAAVGLRRKAKQIA